MFGKPLADSALATRIQVHGLSVEGDGLGVTEGACDGQRSHVLVPGAMPGDRVRIRAATRTKFGLRAQSWQLEQPSSLRVEPRCPVFAACGGCQLMPLERSEQAKYKQWALRALLEAELDGAIPAAFDWFASPPGGYRNRIRLQIDEAGRLSFFNANKSWECRALCPELLAALKAFSTRVTPKRLQAFEHLEIRVPDALGRAGIWLMPRRGSGGKVLQPCLKAGGLHDLEGFLCAVAGEHAPELTPRQRFQLGPELCLEVPLGSFMQVNSAVNRTLVEQVVRGAVSRGALSFADCYAGSGNFALPLSRAGLHGVAVEYDRAAASALSDGVRSTNLPIAEVCAGDTATVAAHWLERGVRPDLVVVDPPRAGLCGALDSVAQLASRWLAVCSCNPRSLVKDVRALCGRGFEVQAIQTFDMFPDTRHLEVLVWLQR